MSMVMAVNYTTYTFEKKKNKALLLLGLRRIKKMYIFRVGLFFEFVILILFLKRTMGCLAPSNQTVGSSLKHHGQAKPACYVAV